MSTTYSSFNTRRTHQNEAIPGEAQMANNAGGFVYQLDPWKALDRFLLIGSEGGTYYVEEEPLTKENALRTMACLAEDGIRVVDRIYEISAKGHAPKNDSAIFALALAASVKMGDAKGRSAADLRSYALAHLPRVCRIPTHLFQFNSYVENMRGRGRSLNRAIRAWYQDTPVDDLAYHMVKYQQREGWSHRDLLRLVRPNARWAADSEQRNALYRWAVKGAETLTNDDVLVSQKLPHIISAFEAAKQNDGNLVHLIKNYNLSREMVPTEALTRPEVWDALLDKMPITATIRNLGNMSKCGLLTPMSIAARLVCDRITDPHLLKKGRVHPIQILIAMKTYASGKGFRGNGEWTVVPQIVDALNDAFYLAFEQLEPTGKRLLLGVDVSGSMATATINNTNITARDAAAALALACVKTEMEYYIMGFTAGPAYRGKTVLWSDYSKMQKSASLRMAGFVPLDITPKMRLDDVIKRTSELPLGPTDCALPMLWATQNKVAVDAFIVLTDNETWAGEVHPSQALRQYREQSGINAKQIVIGMTVTDFTIADPLDALSLDICGFDTATPSVIEEFVR